MTPDKAMSLAADSQESTQVEATNDPDNKLDAETLILGESPRDDEQDENSPDGVMPDDSQPISFGTPPGLFISEDPMSFEADSQQPDEAHDTGLNLDDKFVQGLSQSDELCETQNDIGVPVESAPIDSQPVDSQPDVAEGASLKNMSLMRNWLDSSQWMATATLSSVVRSLATPCS